MGLSDDRLMSEQELKRASRVVDPKGDLFSVFDRAPSKQVVVQEAPPVRREKQARLRKKSMQDLSKFIILYQGTGILADSVMRNQKDDRQEIIEDMHGDAEKLGRLVSDEARSEIHQLLDELAGKLKTENPLDYILAFEKVLEDAVEAWLNA